MAQIPGLATFQPASSVNNDKPLAPCTKRATDEFNELERDLESPSGSQENSLNKAVTGFVLDNKVETEETDNREKPTAPRFESLVKSYDDRGEEENDRGSGAKNYSLDIYPDDYSPDSNRGNDNAGSGKNKSRNKRSRDYSEEKQFRGFDQSSDFPNPWRKPENINVYATKKTIAQGMLDVALLAANATQLKNLLVIGEAYQFYIFALTLVCLSIALQVLVGILFIILGSMDINRRRDQRAAIIINDIILIGIFLISLVNIIIAGFNIDYSYKPPQLSDAGKKIVQGLILIVLGSVYNLNRQADQSKARLWNDISLAVMLLTVIINVVVASFALQDAH